jgi:alkylated DNA nucleotide flippase Atl1
MSKILKSINELMSKQPIGLPMTRSEVAKILGVSEKTIGRAMEDLSADTTGDVIVVFKPSILRVRIAVCPKSDKTEEPLVRLAPLAEESPKDCPELDKTTPEECPELDKSQLNAVSPIREPDLTALPPKGPSELGDIGSKAGLPEGYRRIWHKYLETMVVMNAQGVIDQPLTDKLNAEEAIMREPVVPKETPKESNGSDLDDLWMGESETPRDDYDTGDDDEEEE